MPDEDGPYEIMPYREIVKLKKELEELRDKAGEAPSKDLLKSMDNLTNNMGSMLDMFKAAAEEMKLEEAAPSKVDFKPVLDKLDEIATKLDEMSDKVEETLSENKTIAEGLVAVSDSMEEKFSSLSDSIIELKQGVPTAPAGRPSFSPMPPPMAPAGPMPQGAPMMGMPGNIEGSMSSSGPVPPRLPRAPGPMGPGAMPPRGPPGPAPAPPKKGTIAFTFGKK